MLDYKPVLFLPGVIRAIVDEGKPDTYVLGSSLKFDMGYVGRSDTCARVRLSAHNHLYRFDYFIYKYARDGKETFLFECEAITCSYCVGHRFSIVIS
ncbi:hypothetical protein E8F20_11580 [Pseudomonas sp. BN415]|uniref:hypothetical protein n=1 Tax=Pseudomonas sp. BN415 TaxID=2567889 RepID=UPI002456B4E9|nr:hypothetical protein [Pseudomonas sp. BN415]MDH4582507.1 hypothetical protein [Pseudomonas sp. BN415]